MASTLHSFASAADLAGSLADKVADRLSAAIAARGAASIAVSGGSTPKAFFQALSTRDIAWDKVTITLVDERFVPADNPRSNHLLVDANLLQNKATAARFVPLYQPAASVEEAARLATEKSAEIGIPFDVVILGMGGDGHTASFFPGGSNLAEALDASTPRGVITMEAEGAGEPRLTFTFSSLQDAALLVLHIEGEGKKDVLAKAEGSGDEADMPIRAVLRRATSPVEIYWAP
ncbi:6-phosphogluconolactonase [Rhizobium sophoriradicis]|uniref:6-phosphogluconolactonase n=1 Tax=Rhizobium etli bv. mimosae str. IE4771 TaxID=1432050 RepID=A0A060HSM5_RHIET|nr:MULTISPECIES: 6-phosphogluconolactonase [Rhizobium]AIC25913.1 6-phosphogluconolactonase [Rhizobium sp. IE4771]RSB96623.1 6-phosphogluconolactonase [Rhizobium sophoriradicis]UWU35066.1 6-phosphogluconolactonase [Rhizobium leguminosarum bv. phaseoli]